MNHVDCSGEKKTYVSKRRLQTDLSSDARTPYDPKIASGLKLSNVHVGQRKLLLSEIQLLNEYYDTTKKKKDGETVHPRVVYVGSAPGTHLVDLHRLFPRVKFVLYDGAPFDPVLSKYPDVFELRNDFFDEASLSATGVAPTVGTKKTPKNGPLILISDIRSRKTDNTEGAYEAQVMRDMLSQKRWTVNLRPVLSLLKFRIPFTLRSGDKVSYLGGRLFYGIWPPPESGELRLLVTPKDIDAGEVEYDFDAYEQVLFHHNSVTRRICFSEEDPTFPPEFVPFVKKRYCTCFDCLSELSVYLRYVEVASEKSGSGLDTLEKALEGISAPKLSHVVDNTD
jgi:hypothetical protein